MRVTVVDYGIGNLFSVRRALERAGATVEFAEDAEMVGAAERLVLPGVGAFADGMLGLRERGLVDPIRAYARSGRPLLGICLGMQMLLTTAEEFGEHEGLDLIPGRVVQIPATGLDGTPHKIPHIGWNTLSVPQGARPWSETILSAVRPGDAAYLVHSFTALPEHQHHRLADCYYDGRLIAAAIGDGNVYGCQFHPEKSSKVGLAILASFLDIRAE